MTEYSKSRLRYFYFRIPLSIEWQTKINGKGLNGRPLGINMLVQAGYADLGVYMRYSTYGLFEKHKGPELYPFSFGVCWYW